MIPLLENAGYQPTIYRSRLELPSSLKERVLLRERQTRTVVRRVDTSGPIDGQGAEHGTMSVRLSYTYAHTDKQWRIRFFRDDSVRVHDEQGRKNVDFPKVSNVPACLIQALTAGQRSSPSKTRNSVARTFKGVGYWFLGSDKLSWDLIR